MAFGPFFRPSSFTGVTQQEQPSPAMMEKARALESQDSFFSGGGVRAQASGGWVMP